MENRKDLAIRIILSLTIILLLATMVFKSKDHYGVAPPAPNVCKEDSLQMVVNQLTADLENDENGWDDKEKKYENIIFEYEYGIEHLKHVNPDAYREFHRIIGYKENYTRSIERENKKRLKLTKW